jgi:hypothetical protein
MDSGFHQNDDLRRLEVILSSRQSAERFDSSPCSIALICIAT